MDYIKEALNIKNELIAVRRHLYENPELGFEMKETSRFVKEKLIEYGLEPKDIGKGGVTALIGKPGAKTILLRADMDALPIKDQSDMEFSSKSDNMHACGHDNHATILLGAAKLLKENEDSLKGQVKFIFQPAEELLIGAENMIESGILENPKVDFAMGLHVAPNAPMSGILIGPGVNFAAALNFKITIKGVGAHGANPQDGIDPVYIGAQIVLNAPEILIREVAFDKSASMTMGRFIANGAMNVIPEIVEIEGTIRTRNEETHSYIEKRFPEIVKSIAKTYRGEAEVVYTANCPVLRNPKKETAEVKSYMSEISKDNFGLYDLPGSKGGTSEDFAHYSNQVPSVFFYLMNPYKDTEKLYPVHHPKVKFDENMLPIGAGVMAHVATRWLEENKEN